ncbi:MAG: hypothetical protein ACYDD0_01290 [Candidatus Dormibacteria bacterium]
MARVVRDRPGVEPVKVPGAHEFYAAAPVAVVARIARAALLR